jgi:hypothetical protein
LYVYKVGDKYGVTSFSETQNSSLPSLISNPGTVNDNANGYGYVGTLQNLNVFGDIILIDTLSFYIRDNHTSKGVNLDTPIWCRLYKFVNDWELVYQSNASIKQRDYSSGDLISFKMENKSNSTIKSSDKIAIIYSSTDDISIFSSTNWGTKATTSRGGGLNNGLNTSSTGASNYQPGIIVNYVSMADTPVNAVTIENAQTITGTKQFNNGISIGGKSTITSSIDSGELKVLHNNSNKGFIIRTKNTDANILPLEILTTNGSASYQYNFPTNKGGNIALIDDIPTYSAVTGVKGNSESTYRTGNVNITKANIGLGNVDNTADSAKSVNYATSAGSVSKSLTVGTQTYNGSAAVTITAADLGFNYHIVVCTSSTLPAADSRDSKTIYLVT